MNVVAFGTRPQQPLLEQLFERLRPRTFEFPELVLGWTEQPCILHLTQLKGEEPEVDVEVVLESKGTMGLCVTSYGPGDKASVQFGAFDWPENLLRDFTNWFCMNASSNEAIGPAVLVMTEELHTLIHPDRTTDGNNVVPLKR